MNERKSISFLGVTVDVLDTGGLLQRVMEYIDAGKKARVMYTNTDCMLKAYWNEEYRSYLNRAEIVYADGVGIVYGARLWGHRLPGRSTGADFMPEFCRCFAKRGFKIFLLGARPGVAELAAEKLVGMIPDLKIVGTHHGYFKPEELDNVIQRINETEPHILIVGLGAPHQEKWIMENSDKLNVAVVWGGGGLLDFLSGNTWRGPKWLLDNGFEWLCRLIVEPGRLWRRYIIGNTLYVVSLFWFRYIDRNRFRG